MPPTGLAPGVATAVGLANATWLTAIVSPRLGRIPAAPETAAWIAVGLAFVVAIERLVRRKPVTNAIGGVLGTGLAVFIALRSGQASGYFVPRMIYAAALALLFAAPSEPASAQSATDEGQKLAFDRGKGNCLTCHVIKGGDLPGTIGPELIDIKKKYPKRDELLAIVFDETKRNPLTVMPPFGRNRILTEKEINAVVDFLQTL